MPPTHALSFCSWVKLTEGESNSDSHIFALSTPDDPNMLLVAILPNKVSIHTDDSLLEYHSSTISYIGVWTHFCGSLSDSGAVIYVNGTQVISSSLQIYQLENIVDGVITLGNDVDNGIVNDRTQCILGELTKLFLFKKVLTQTEVQNVYQGYMTNLKIDIIAAWSDFKGLIKSEEVYETEYPCF